MSGRKTESRATKASGEGAGHSTGAVFTATTTITTTNGEVLTVSEYISRFDEAAKKRLHSMNQKLLELETQMEALEAQISRVHDSVQWA